MRRVHLDTIDSTNEEVRRLVREGCALPIAVTATVQTGGRGRHGRAWASPAGGVWLSIGWRTARTMRETGALGMVLALGVVRAVDGVAPGMGSRVRIKWPNDVLVDGQKVCGVVCERAGDVVVGGVGVNGDFGVGALPEGVHETATTLRDAMGCAVDAGDLTERVVEGVWGAVGVFEAHGVREAERAEVESRLAMRGEAVRIEIGRGEVVEGVLAGIGSDGSAMVERDGERIGVSMGEVVRARGAGVGGGGGGVGCGRA